MYFPQFRRHADQVIVGCRHRQSVRTVSMPLSNERSRSDENCSLCPIRQLGSSLYFRRFLTDGFDAPFANRPLRTRRPASRARVFGRTSGPLEHSGTALPARRIGSGLVAGGILRACRAFWANEVRIVRCWHQFKAQKAKKRIQSLAQ